METTPVFPVETHLQTTSNVAVVYESLMPWLHMYWNYVLGILWVSVLWFICGLFYVLVSLIPFSLAPWKSRVKNRGPP